ncbi:hypothetical protein DWW52_02950 [Odoribacter sp. AF15-53]|nr:hypothetical protein DWW52_02950 [Odoribacter sp. AF15-53]
MKGYILEKGRNGSNNINDKFMKKKILGLVACLGIALFFAINVSINLSKDHSKNGLALKNIEALARGEGDSATGGSKAYTGKHFVGGAAVAHIKTDGVSAGCWCVTYNGFEPDGESVCTCNNV